MHDTQELKVTKWPFFLGDAFLLGLAYFVCWQGKAPLGRWEITAAAICVALGAWLGILPFLLEYRALLKKIETSALGTAAEKIKDLETLAAQISGATNHWQSAQDQADKTAALAREIAERMAAEVRDFTEFMKGINEGEKATLRLEVEKLRRAENDWLNVLVHMLDHVHALHLAAERAGQANLITQLGHFQNACRDAARRVGLVPLGAALREPFDPQRHQWADGDSPPAGAIVAEIVATGYTFQGRPLRPVLVRVRNDATPADASSASATAETLAAKPPGQRHLPLEPEGEVSS
jgi:molecular chaperone GrpE (heat shock protein)